MIWKRMKLLIIHQKEIFTVLSRRPGTREVAYLLPYQEHLGP